MSKLYVTKNNRHYERKRDKITISLTHAPSTVFSTTQLVLEFHLCGTGEELVLIVQAKQGKVSSPCLLQHRIFCIGRCWKKLHHCDVISL